MQLHVSRSLLARLLAAGMFGVLLCPYIDGVEGKERCNVPTYVSAAAVVCSAELYSPLRQLRFCVPLYQLLWVPVSPGIFSSRMSMLCCGCCIVRYGAARSHEVGGRHVGE